MFVFCWYVFIMTDDDYIIIITLNCYYDCYYRFFYMDFCI